MNVILLILGPFLAQIRHIIRYLVLPRGTAKTAIRASRKSSLLFRHNDKTSKTSWRSHLVVLNIDKALRAGDLHSLMEVTKVRDFATLLTNDLDSSYEQCAPVAGTDSFLKNVESQLLIKHAQVISDLEKEIDDDPEHACCSCEHLQQRKSVTRVKLSDHLGSKFWPDLKAFILEHNPDANEQVLYMCNYCKPLIKKDTLPPRCVLNAL